MPDPTTIPSGAGAQTGFFDFWVFGDETVPPTPNAVGLSETLYPPAPGFDAVAKTKRLVRPITLTIGSPNFQRQLASLAAAVDIGQWLAALIADEIGHGLGLLHAVLFTVTTPASVGNDGVSSYAKATRNGTMTSVRVVGNDAQSFSPAHK